MSTSHFWLQSGAHSLLAHLHAPPPDAPRHRTTGVLIAPSFGIEDIFAHRTLRALAVLLASNGFPVLRFDLPGTGDSSGGPLDSGLFAAWIESIRAAGNELRTSACISRVAVVGFRMGALLALQAIRQNSNFGDLVLWAPPITGRAILREFMAMDKLEAGSSPDPSNGSDPEGTIQLVGFKMSAETRQDLASVDSRNPSRMLQRRVLILTRDGFSDDHELVYDLAAAGYSVEKVSNSGYCAMMVPPHESVTPTASLASITDFLNRGETEKPLLESTFCSNLSTPARAPAQCVELESGVSECCVTIKISGAETFGILCQPVDTPVSDTLLLLLNAGAVRHIGPNRMWVDIARRWAKHGVPSFRFDFMGVGDSNGTLPLTPLGLYGEGFFEQIATTIRTLVENRSAKNFIAIGLCSGAYWAFQAATIHPEIRSAILLNPRLFFADPEVDRRRAVHHMRASVSSSRAWHRLFNGHIKARRLKAATQAAVRGAFEYGDGPQIPEADMKEALNKLEHLGTRLAYIFAEGEPLLREMYDEGHLPSEDNRLFRCFCIPDASHTFHRSWAQELANSIIDRQIAASLPQSPFNTSLETPEEKGLDFIQAFGPSKMT